MNAVYVGNIIRKILTAVIAVTVIGTTAANAMIPNPLISRGKTVKASNGNASQLVDGKFGSGVFTVSANSWFAIDVGIGPSRIFITWNNPAYTWSNKIADPNKIDCKQTLSYPVNYTIQTSANSTSGIDGDWTTAITVTGNKVSARGHSVEFTGMKWVKMNISSGGGNIDEVEVFNTSNGAEDTWFFAGTSISANAYKSASSATTFSILVNQAHKDFNPAMIRGGIPCISSTHMARDISMYLEAAGSCHYWAIEMGTNDAWGGTKSNVTSFKTSMQKVIDSCRAHGIEPIIANILSTNQSAAGWQVNADYPKAIADLAKSNGLIEGPDFYAAFQSNTSFYNTDGVHPSNTGGVEMHKLWAEKMDALYKTVKNEKRPEGVPADYPHCPFTMTIYSDRWSIIATEPGTIQIFNLKGCLRDQIMVGASAKVDFSRLNGCAVVRFISAKGITTMQLVK
ncbi:MAG: SGNH/GDSL hydrolase family protein [Chitinispirillaceae bacterium]|nr:SGNH/GDSL hydrolase family protein [Chitinispirillaceae bacterium]